MDRVRSVTHHRRAAAISSWGPPLEPQCVQTASNMATNRISTRSLDALPSIEGLLQLSKALAMLDAVLSPEWEYRYYSFNSKWDLGESMASMRNGSGDEYFILFNKHGAAMTCL